LRKKTLTLLMVVAFVGTALSLAQADVIRLEPSSTGNSTADGSQLGPSCPSIPHVFTAVMSNGDAVFGRFYTGYGDVGLQTQSGPFGTHPARHSGTTRLRTVTENGVDGHNAHGSASFISERDFSDHAVTNAAFSAVGFNIALVNFLHLSAIPEPASLFLIGAGLLGIAGISRLKFGRK